MFKKPINLFLLLHMILFIFIVLVGCSNSMNSIFLGYTCFEKSYQEDIDGQFYVASNKNDLSTILQNDATEKYNEEFFSTKYLMIIKNVESSNDTKTVIETCEIQDEKLNIHFKTTHLGENYVMTSWWYILELNKTEFDKINSIQVFKNGEEINNSYKQTLIDYIKYANSTGLDVTNSKMEILENYGYYNGVFIFRISRSAFNVITYISIIDGGINIQFPDTNTPLVYKNGTFFELIDAYNIGIVTKENLLELQNKLRLDAK